MVHSMGERDGILMWALLGLSGCCKCFGNLFLIWLWIENYFMNLIYQTNFQGFEKIMILTRIAHKFTFIAWQSKLIHISNTSTWRHKKVLSIIYWMTSSISQAFLMLNASWNKHKKRFTITQVGYFLPTS